MFLISLVPGRARDGSPSGRADGPWRSESTPPTVTWAGGRWPPVAELVRRWSSIVETPPQATGRRPAGRPRPATDPGWLREGSASLSAAFRSSAPPHCVVKSGWHLVRTIDRTLPTSRLAADFFTLQMLGTTMDMGFWALRPVGGECLSRPATTATTTARATRGLPRGAGDRGRTLSAGRDDDRPRGPRGSSLQSRGMGGSALGDEVDTSVEWDAGLKSPATVPHGRQGAVASSRSRSACQTIAGHYLRGRLSPARHRRLPGWAAGAGNEWRCGRPADRQNHDVPPARRCGGRRSGAVLRGGAVLVRGDRPAGGEARKGGTTRSRPNAAAPKRRKRHVKTRLGR